VSIPCSQHVRPPEYDVAVSFVPRAVAVEWDSRNDRDIVASDTPKKSKKGTINTRRFHEPRDPPPPLRLSRPFYSTHEIETITCSKRDRC
jgi:hypothetical protein